MKEEAALNDGQLVRILILIPVLREQNVIRNTLDHFLKLKLHNIELCVCVAGTSREMADNNSITTTGDVAREWIEQNRNTFNPALSVRYAEVNEDRGDRASQLNHAAQEVTKSYEPNVIGVYDADSLPDEATLLEVASVFRSNPNIILQQPVHFICAANRMAREKKNPVLVANALYQTNWTIIRELSRWAKHIDYYNKNRGKIYKRNDYLIGHGEFIPYGIYKQFLFPEQEITDGIQLGYRVSMAGIPICPTHAFCVDDVPQGFSQLIGQHKRWFGGCNRLVSSYNWCQRNIGRTSFAQLMDGFWSQLSWAYAAPTTIIALALSIYHATQGNFIFLIILTAFLLTYCYVFPYLSHRLFPVKTKVRLIDWISLPIAIGLKGVGPNIYMIEKIWSSLFRREIRYSKVER